MDELFEYPLGTTIRWRGPDGSIQILTVVARTTYETLGDGLQRCYILRDSNGSVSLDAGQVEQEAL